MDDNKGWIAISRNIIEHWIWQDPTKLKMWLDLLLLAAFRPTRFASGSHIYEVNRGELSVTLRYLATRWGVSKDTVRRFLRLLETDEMITQKCDKHRTLITICNYDSYQRNLDVCATNVIQSCDKCATSVRHINNNVNNYNNIISHTAHARGEDFLSLDKLEQEMLDSTLWLESVAMIRHLSMPRLQQLLHSVCDEWRCAGIDGKTLSDAKNHFSKRLAIILQNEKSSITRPDSSNNPNGQGAVGTKVHGFHIISASD